MEIGEGTLLFMNRKRVSAVTLTLLLTSMWALAFNIQPAKATPTTIIVPDNYPTIQEAINAVGSGDTVFVRVGTYIENVVVDKPLKLIGENKHTTIIDGNDAGSAVTIASSNVTVTGFTLQHGGPDFPEGGILIDVASDSNISHNIIKNNAMGILFYGSSRNLIDNNVISDNWYGIELYGYSRQNIFSNNNLLNNVANFLMFRSSSNMVVNNTVLEGNFGFVVEQSNYNIFKCNIVSNIGWSGFRILDGCRNNQLLNNRVSNCLEGFELSGTSNNTLMANIVSNNRRYAIFIAQAHNNTIACNEILNNAYGISLYEASKNNTIYHNNIINNTQQTYLMFSPTNNTWDNGYTSGGNYWSDYTGVDIYSGSYQNATGSDGIGDTPYIIDADNVDHYPLMNPYGAPPPPTYTLTITATIGGTTDPAPGTYSYTANSTVQVTAIPEANYLFDYWELDSINVGSANPYTVYMDKDHTLEAVFSPIPPPLSASVSPLSASILVGQSVTFTSTVSGGYTPYSYQWYLNGAPVSGATSNTCTFTPTTSGIYYIYLKATDAKANTAQSDTARITVATVPVGGYSFPIQVQTKAEPVLPYIALIAILTAIFTKLKPKTKRKR